MVTTQSPPQNSASVQSLYEQDFQVWLDTTVQSLREGKLLEVDYENLIEELESMGRSEKNALKSNLKILLMHLLKYQFQPEKRSNSWRFTITEHRDRLIDCLEDSPSLRNYLEDNLEKCYGRARRFATEETGFSLNQFPENLPFTITEILDLDFLPEKTER